MLFSSPFPFPPSLSFLSPQHLLLPFLEEVCVYFTFLLFFPSPLVSFKFGIRVCLRMSVTNCSQTLWQCFSFPPVPFLWPSYFFFSFFLFFPSRSGAPDVKEPRYGASPISFSFFFFDSPLFVPNPCFHNSFNLPYFPSISLSRWFLCPFILCYLCVLHVRLHTPVLSTGPAPGAAPLMATPAAGNALTLSLTCLFWSWCCAVTNRTQNAQSQSSAVILAVWLY